MIEQPTVFQRNGVATAIGVLSAISAATFFFGALLHLGIKVPLGFTVLEEPGSYLRPSSRDCADWRWRSPPSPCSPAGIGHGRSPLQPTPSPWEAFCSV